jgi:hypothetical protein
LNGLSRQRQSLDAVLDLRVKRYLKDMQTRARDGLLWSIYNFDMAYRYEYLKSVPSEVLSIDRMIEGLQKIAGVDQAGGRWTIKYEDFKSQADMVWTNELYALYIGLIDRRNKMAGLTQSPIKWELGKSQCEELTDRGEITLNVVRDKNLRWDMSEAKIDGIIDLNVVLTTKNSNTDLSLPFVFEHSGASVIRNAEDGTYYWFTMGAGKPITWGFTYNHQPKPKDKEPLPQTITPDKLRDDEERAALNQFIKNMSVPGKELILPTYKDHAPSLFSDITLKIPVRVWPHPNLDKIESVKFTNYSRRL